MQFCQFGGFLDQKSRFRIFFENLKNSETFFFVIGKRIKLSAVCKKNHRNRTNGFGDIALRSKKIIEISRLFFKSRKIFMIFEIWSTITFEPFVRFRRFFFCKLLTILLPFQIKKEKFKFFSKLRNILENVIFDQKTAKLATLQNQLNNLKIIVRFGISARKLGKYEIFRLWHFFVDRCN